MLYISTFDGCACRGIGWCDCFRKSDRMGATDAPLPSAVVVIVALGVFDSEFISNVFWCGILFVVYRWLSAARPRTGATDAPVPLSIVKMLELGVVDSRFGGNGFCGVEFLFGLADSESETLLLLECAFTILALLEHEKTHMSLNQIKSFSIVTFNDICCL